MVSETSAYLLIGLAFLNVGVVGWVLVAVTRQAAAGPGIALPLLARFDSADRNAEALRRDLNQLGQAVLAEVARGSRDALEAAFAKVQDGARAQAEQLARFQDSLTQFGGNVGTALESLRHDVTKKLADSETGAARGRADLARDTADAIARARDAIDASLKTFGDQQRERLQNAEQAVRDSKEAVVSLSLTTQEALAGQRQAITAQLTDTARANSDRLGKELGDLAERVRSGFDAFSTRLRDEQEQLRGKVDAKLEEIRTGNEEKLEKMRQAVDEQLQTALGKRIDERFQSITEQFAHIQQEIGQVKDVAGQIGDLKRLFSNVKMRGGIGEDHLGVLLDDFLPPGSYQKNLRIEGGSEIVEYAVRIPTKGNPGSKFLAIDAKFPTEDYQRLVQASEANDRDQEAAARKALERKIRDEAKRISSRYIKPPQTLDFAVMYLPSEGLDTEVSRMPGLVEALRRQYAIHVMGPRLLPAHLHCIRVGYLTLALEEKAGAIGEILSAVKVEWTKLGKSLDGLANKANTLVNGIHETQRRTRVVGSTLKTVETIDFDRAEQILGLPGEMPVIEAPDDGDESARAAAPLFVPAPATSTRREAAD
jgi:DNA recombination protein RmuC